MDCKSHVHKIKDMAERIPLVYTTKLDDMNIFMTTITDLNVDSIIDAVIKESKPEFKLNRKRKLRPSPHFTYEDLTFYINEFNRKVARKAEIGKCDPFSLCKPVSVVLEDIKYLLRAAPHNSTSKNENVQKANLKDWYRPSIKSRPYSSQKSKIIYDAHSKEYDIYLFDNECLIKQYTRIQANNSNSKVFLTFKEDKPFFKVICCCWYNREWYIKCQRKHHRTSIKFMKKQHKCTADLCHCCCRTNIDCVLHNTSLKEVTVMDTNKQISKAETSSHKILEAPSTWYNRITERNSMTKLIPTSLRVSPVVNPTNDNVKYNLPVLHTTNIKLGDEFYEIGTKGQIKLFYKGLARDSSPYSEPPSVSNIISGNICCWYKRQNFAASLLGMGALPNSVNFLRLPHLCSVTNCSCCCKPIPYHNKKLLILPVTVRYTNNFISTKGHSEIQSEKNLNTKPVSNVIPRTNNIASFNISLEALNKLSNTTDTAIMPYILNEIMPETNVLHTNSVVRFIIDSRKRKIVVEGVDLSSITTKELKMLDILFKIIENTLPEHCKPITKMAKARREFKRKLALEKSNPCECNINSRLSLNEQISVTMDLRYKRFLPSLRDHLKMFKFPYLKDIIISGWLDHSTTDTRLRVKSPNETCNSTLLHKFLTPKP